MNEKVNLSAPWITYKNELCALFANDPDISIMYDDEEKRIKLFVAKRAKAEALERILNTEKTFGNVTLQISVIPPNEEDYDILEDFEEAFQNNYDFRQVLPVETPLGTHRYVGFDKRVVQFFNDQLDDPYGNRSMLLQDIAKDVFKENLSVHYFTVP